MNPVSLLPHLVFGFDG